MKKIYIISLLLITLGSCKKEYEVIMPNTNSWSQFNDPAATALPATARTAIEGVYDVVAGASFFGPLTAVKSSYVIRNNDTTFHVSGFFGKDIAYLSAKENCSMDKYCSMDIGERWSAPKPASYASPLHPSGGANLLLSLNPALTAGSIQITGLLGQEQNEPSVPVSLIYNRPLHQRADGFQVMAHRSGGRTSDLLPHSENSIPMILKTAEFGSTGIEIDVRFTKDGIPILYHDNTLNLRLVQKNGLVGKIENYTYDQLNTFVRLIHGERIPTLREALQAVLYQTPLTMVWLDTKYIGSIAPLKAIQTEYQQRAANAGRQLDILIGLPGQDQLSQFEALPDFRNTPSLCELSIADAERINAKVWAPRFTEGTQNDNVALVRGQGRKAFVWTLDVPEFIERFIRDGNFDGILSNFPSCVAYHYYVQP